MQARKLKKLLNTGYIVQNCGEYAAIGSIYVHDIIKIDKQTLDIKVDYRIGDSAGLKNLLDILSKLKESGELRDILDSKDEIPNPLPVFCYRGNQIVESKTDDYEWPNTDDDGYLLYENTIFKTRAECRADAFLGMAYGLRSISEQLEQAKNEINRLQSRVAQKSEALLRLAKEEADEMLKYPEDFNTSGGNVKETGK